MQKSYLGRLTVLLLLLALTACSKCSEPSRPLLWRIDTSKPSYLFGTIHIPDERLEKLHSLVADAIDGADEVYTEVKMDLGSQMRAAKKAMLPDGKTLKDVLPPDLYRRVKTLFEEKKVPSALLSVKIWAVTVQVAIVDHMHKMLTKQPIDTIIFMRAAKAKKVVGGIETIDEQIQMFDVLTTEEQIYLLRNELDEREKRMKENVDILNVLMETYLKGDDQELMRRLMEEYDPNDPIQKKLMKGLFTDRNHRMADRIAEKMKASPEKSFFFAVGAGHMPGEEGIVSLLRKQGYQITRLGDKK